MSSSKIMAMNEEEASMLKSKFFIFLKKYTDLPSSYKLYHIKTGGRTKAHLRTCSFFELKKTRQTLWLLCIVWTRKWSFKFERRF